MEKLHFNLRVTEAGDVANRLATLYKKTTALQDDAFLKTAFEQLQQQATEITEAVKKGRVASDLEEADSQRDNAIRVLDKLLKGYEAIPVESLKAHGEKLSAVFKKYGVKIIEENYSSQSNLIDSLLMDFSATDLQASISALSGMSEAIAGVRQAQQHFSQLRSEYEKAVAQNQSQVSASALRKPLVDLINKKIVPYLNAMQIAQPATYSAFVGEAKQIIEGMNEVIKARSKKMAKKKNELKG